MLLTILVVVAGNQWLGLSRLADWDKTVWITIYPIAGDSSEGTDKFIASLQRSSFADIGSFLSGEAKRYGIDLPEPVVIQLANPLAELPPAVPANNNPLQVGWWSLKMRWWAWQRGRADNLPAADIQLFITYTQGNGAPVLDRSVAVRKGRYAIINAFANSGAVSRNRVVIAHELLHIFGASDKYSMVDLQPIHPGGYAEPLRNPLWPQRRAEIMGGRVAFSASEVKMPASLSQCVIGPETAREIGWSTDMSGRN